MVRPTVCCMAWDGLRISAVNWAPLRLTLPMVPVCMMTFWLVSAQLTTRTSICAPSHTSQQVRLADDRAVDHAGHVHVVHGCPGPCLGGAGQEARVGLVGDAGQGDVTVVGGKAEYLGVRARHLPAPCQGCGVLGQVGDHAGAGGLHVRISTTGTLARWYTRRPGPDSSIWWRNSSVSKRHGTSNSPAQVRASVACGYS